MKRLSDCVKENILLSSKQIRVKRDRFIKIALKTLIDAVHTI